MTIQTGAGTSLAYKVEASLNTKPTASGAKLIRRVSGIPTLSKTAIQSREVRPDSEISALTHGSRSVQADIGGELSMETWDDWIEAGLRGTWAAGATTTGTFGVTGGAITRSAGSWITDGFRVGDVVRASGFAGGGAANNGVNLRVTAITATDLTVADTLTAVAAAPGVTIAVAGMKLVPALVKRSFSIEARYTDISKYQVFTGLRIGRMSLGLQPNDTATIAFSMIGMGADPMGAQYFTNPTAAPTTGTLTASGGKLRIAGSDVGVVTGIDLQIDNTLSTRPVVGSDVVPDVFYGRRVITGTLTALFENETLVNAYLNETDTEMTFMMIEPGTEPRRFLSFNMQRMKFSGATIQAEGDEGALISMPFQALLLGAVEGKDSASITIQRSNV